MKKLLQVLTIIVLLIGFASTSYAGYRDPYDVSYDDSGESSHTKMMEQFRAEKDANAAMFDSVVSDPVIKNRIKNLGWTIKEFKEKMIYSFSDSYYLESQINSFLNNKEGEIQSAKNKIDFEKKAKIHNGKQYICSDGYDKVVLKYNGNQYTFGGINFSGYNSRVKIDRANSTIRYNGTLFTCIPR